ncbi:MAG: L-seryl-tRNA(Sec) selenium transferase [Pirellulaceae bacterium]|nr:L-seryl-tRNA(Sec) selenium transferase [Pirellulaceae bacterium]
MSNLLRNIPSVNELLESPQLRTVVKKLNRGAVVSGVRDFLTNFREEIQTAVSDVNIPTATELADQIADWIIQTEQPKLRPVINATGVLLHTGLGRAPLAEEARNAIATVADGYANLEVNLESGARSQRVDAVEKLLCQTTGAEAAAVVNNNAGATLLVLAAIAAGRKVIVSRGQLVEIGGSFRLPEVMAQSGAILAEVGTTNKTHLEDFEAAIGEDCAAMMRVHPSNFVIEGFTATPSLEALVALGHKHNIPVIDDVGSGALIDFAKYGVTGEPIVPASIKTGADLVLFSGDKLLGGPQCGIIVGRKALIKQVATHPLMRAFRVDKVTLAALAATLRLYQEQEIAEERVPLLSLLSTPIENLKNRAERLAPQLAALPSIQSAEPIQDHSFLGGGSVPSQKIPTYCVALTPTEGSIDQFAQKLRLSSPAIFGRVKQNRLMLDLRTVFPRQDTGLMSAVRALGSQPEPEQEK